jgi:GNAT superfamily N-acetyltransferase
MEVNIASASDIPKLIPALVELRPHRTPEYFHEMIPVQFGEGFQLIYVGDEKMAYAVAGFRTINFLFSGKTLYVDDLVTHSAHQRKGYGRLLMDWMINYAKENGYDHFSLDSGFQRKDAHRLYLNCKLEITSFHFSRPVNEL